jgi:hypothetical protein
MSLSVYSVCKVAELRRTDPPSKGVIPTAIDYGNENAAKVHKGYTAIEEEEEGVVLSS